MRFEAKHNYFKKLVDKINNFKNITYSLARRHQALQAYLRQASAGNFLRNSLEVGPGREIIFTVFLIIIKIICTNVGNGNLFFFFGNSVLISPFCKDWGLRVISCC